MRNYWRAVRQSLRFRYSLAATLSCSLAVALLWGANIGLVYPVVEVVFRGESLQEWVATRIHDADTASAQIAAMIAHVEARLPQAGADDRPKLARQLSYLQTRLEGEQR